MGDIIDPKYLKSLYEGENFEVKVKKYFEDNPAPSDGN